MVSVDNMEVSLILDSDKIAFNFRINIGFFRLLSTITYQKPIGF